jgi:hypothetical protein
MHASGGEPIGQQQVDEPTYISTAEQAEAVLPYLPATLHNTHTGSINRRSQKLGLTSHTLQQPQHQSSAPCSSPTTAIPPPAAPHQSSQTTIAHMHAQYHHLNFKQRTHTHLQQLCKTPTALRNHQQRKVKPHSPVAALPMQARPNLPDVPLPAQQQHTSAACHMHTQTTARLHVTHL